MIFRGFYLPSLRSKRFQSFYQSQNHIAFPISIQYTVIKSIYVYSNAIITLNHYFFPFIKNLNFFSFNMNPLKHKE